MGSNRKKKVIHETATQEKHMKSNTIQSYTRDQVPILSYIVTFYLITIGLLALIR